MPAIAPGCRGDHDKGTTAVPLLLSAAVQGALHEDANHQRLLQPCL